jgi:hypothetical protein
MLTYNFSEEKVNIILSALAELPAKYSMDVIMDIRKQTADQLAEKEKPVDEPKED